MEISDFLCKISMKVQIPFANEIPACSGCLPVVGLFLVPAFPQHRSLEFTGAALGSSSPEIPHKILLSWEGALLTADLFPMNNSTTSCHCCGTHHTRFCHGYLQREMGRAEQGFQGLAWNIPCVGVGLEMRLAWPAELQQLRADTCNTSPKPNQTWVVDNCSDWV